MVQQSAPPPQVIVIEPAQPSVVFVPAYNPMYVFGPWPYPAYAPFFFPPPPGFWFSRTIATGIAWGIGIGVALGIASPFLNKLAQIPEKPRAGKTPAPQAAE